MQQIDISIYSVETGETVTVEVVSEGVNNFATFVLDGGPLQPINTTPLTYRFRVSVGSGSTHFGMVSCFFPSDAADNASYSIFLTGSRGGGTFADTVIRKGDSIPRAGIEFRRP